MKKLFTLLLMLVICFTLISIVIAESTDQTDSVENAMASLGGDIANPVQSKHSIIVGGKTLNYTATAGTIPVALGENRCEIFYIAYMLDGIENVGERPITFAFNGGPGSSSEWLHMGALGPRRVEVDEMGNLIELPAKIVDNEYTILGSTDLVFIDPVDTGYSTVSEGSEVNAFFTYSRDIASVGEFIRLYVTQNGRWSSPKYIAGESYGTIRAIGLAECLTSTYSMGVNGILLVSSINDFSTSTEIGGGDSAYAMTLPSFANVAKYHNRLAEPYQSMEMDTFLDEVRDFASGDYQMALFKGVRLTETERNAVAEKIAAYTGLKKEFVLSSNLRVPLMEFCMELLDDQGMMVGRLDGRYTGPKSGNEYRDPSDTALDSAYGMAINQYLGDELGYHTDKPYVTLSDNALYYWSFESDNKALDQKKIIENLMNENKFLKIWVICGYYDLATPIGSAEWVYDHIFVRDEVRKNLKFSYFESGHMFYLHLPSLVRFQEEAEEWYQGK